MSFQALLNELSNGWRAQRSLSQMTLGEMISELEKLPADKLTENLSEPHSYRGYYSDLALEKSPGTRTVGEILTDLRESLGQTFTGYKGGDFYMDDNTPLWITDYGCCGLKIVAINSGDIISFETEEDND